MKSRLEGQIVGLDEGAAMLGVQIATLRHWLSSGSVRLPNLQRFRLGPPPFFHPVGLKVWIALRHELDTWCDAYTVASTTGIQ